MTCLLAIESSCDDTSAAVLIDGAVKSNIVSSQQVHASYGGVVPEMASRAHMENIVPVVMMALTAAGVDKKDINLVAFTQAPGLLGSLFVGASFAKAFAQARNIPLITVHHMQAHVMAHFIEDPKPTFPFLCLTVSGGHTQLVYCKDHHQMEVVGTTIDDAAGEAFDKVAKMLGLPYPGGPLVDKLAKEGNPFAYKFPITLLPDNKFSFSGIKTAVLYFLQKMEKEEPGFTQKNIADICASVQHTIIQMLLKPLARVAAEMKVTQVGIAGGVSANSGLRKAIQEMGDAKGWQVFIPSFQYCTDNAGMIAITAWYKHLAGQYASLDVVPSAKASW